jgi:riboflavin synthase
MFTGIVEEVGHVASITRGQKSIALKIACEKVLEDVHIGDSIAVNGICLTVVEHGTDYFVADVMPETMRMTSLAGLKASSPVNLERALRLADRLGGHIVSGHIDGTGEIINCVAEDNAIWITIKAPENIMRYIIYKGSVALDGISLTVASVAKDSFKVSIIPHTGVATTLGVKHVGDVVNIECDEVAKYIEKFLVSSKEQKDKKDISIDFLKQNGFY